MRPVRVAAKAVIVREGKLLALRKTGETGDYFMLPGGGHQVGETLEETLRRECREETDANIRIGQVIWIRDYQEGNHEFAHRRPDFHQLEIMFRCELMSEPDMASRGDTGQLGLVWIPLDEIEQWPFYPQALRSRLATRVPQDGATYLGDVN